jgi:hypothetical protein
VGALAVHELRYVIAGRHEDAEVHAYMPWLLPIACALLGLALAEFAGRLVMRISTGDGPRDMPAGVRWLSVSTLLTGIFALQEMAERLVADGRVDVAHSLIVHGGWVALPLCFAVGAIIALLLRGARALLTHAWGWAPAPRPAIADEGLRLRRSRAPRLPAIACHLAGRGPPVVI